MFLKIQSLHVLTTIIALAFYCLNSKNTFSQGFQYFRV